MDVAASLGGLKCIMQSLWQIITVTIAEYWFLMSIVLFPAELPDNVPVGNCDFVCVWRRGVSDSNFENWNKITFPKIQRIGQV